MGGMLQGIISVHSRGTHSGGLCLSPSVPKIYRDSSLHYSYGKPFPFFTFIYNFKINDKSVKFHEAIISIQDMI